MELELPGGAMPVRFYALGGQPLAQVRFADGSEAILAVDPASGAFVPRHDLWLRIGESWSTELDRLSERDFVEQVRAQRFERMVERLAAHIAWARTGDGIIPYRAKFRGRELRLRINDFPAEPLYSVMWEDQSLGDLEDWPPRWFRPD